MATKRKFDVQFKLEVIKYSEVNSGEATARHFGIDPKRVREWKKQKKQFLNLPTVEHQKRARLRGGGRKKVSEELEAKLSEWIRTMRAQRQRPSRRMVKSKAKELDGGSDFRASAGWLDKFLLRNGFSVRGHTNAAQKDTNHLKEKIVSYMDDVNNKVIASETQISNKITKADEMDVCYDKLESTTVDLPKVRNVSRDRTGHEESYLTEVLAAKGDGMKVKPHVNEDEEKLVQRQLLIDYDDIVVVVV